MEDREPYITEGSKMRDKFLTEAMGLYKEPKWKVIVTITYKGDGGVQFRGTKEECDLYRERHIDKGYWGVPDKPIQSKARVINFSTWEGFGKLWEWASKQGWWGLFQGAVFYEPPACWECGLGDTKLDCINPNAFADAIYEYLKNKVDKGDK